VAERCVLMVLRFLADLANERRADGGRAKGRVDSPNQGSRTGGRWGSASLNPAQTFSESPIGYSCRSL
jgi:hypothetical protein